MMSRTSIDCMMQDFRMRARTRYGTNEGDAVTAPLFWYVNTDRCPLDTLAALLRTNSRQRTTIIKRLASGGTYEDALDSMKEYMRKVGLIH